MEMKHLNHPWTDAIFELQLALRHRQFNQTWSICSEIESSFGKHLFVYGGLYVLKDVSSLNEYKPSNNIILTNFYHLGSVYNNMNMIRITIFTKILAIKKTVSNIYLNIQFIICLVRYE